LLYTAGLQPQPLDAFALSQHQLVQVIQALMQLLRIRVVEFLPVILFFLF
jgi:hypothetical protein